MVKLNAPVIIATGLMIAGIVLDNWDGIWSWDLSDILWTIGASLCLVMIVCLTIVLHKSKKEVN